jgi:flavin-binding protein dodecin
MTVAKTIEVTARSSESFDAAIRDGINKASDTVEDIRQAWVMNQKVLLTGGEITEYQVDLKVTFVVH